VDLPARDDVLAQPTRGRLFAMLGDLHRPAGTEELAERLQLHPNGIRLHLERLREAGLVARERTRQARGRPRETWSIAAGARPGGQAPSAYADLGGWLARAISPDATSLRSVEDTGREIGRDLAADGGQATGAERLQAAFASLGFQPQREPGPGGDVTYRLCNCPYRQAVRENQTVVCTLHRGITRGLLDVIQPGTELTGFVPKDPDVAGCLVELRGEPADG
jgi:predicted ArsR family transcriptional regulator